MQKAYYIVFIILCVLYNNCLFAQRSIQGTVRDSLGFPLKSVNVLLVDSQDSLNNITDDNGVYRFHKIVNDTVSLTFNMLGYKTVNKTHSFFSDNAFVFMPEVKMKLYDHVIPVVNILKVLPVVNNGDTTQFNFGAYSFRENALLEEALKNLPGFQVYRDGSVTFNGKHVRKVRVDNKDFFGGDLITATRNLPAEFIQNIQLINVTTLQEDGILREDGDKILNITLKEDKKKIYFGQVTAGAGTDQRYLGSFGLNKFDKGKELSVIGSFNNTNTSLFTFGNPMGGDRIKSTTEIGDFAEPIDGLNNVSSIGVNVADQLNKVVYFTGSYNYIYQKNLINGNSHLTSSYIGNTIKKTEDYVINTTDRNHRFKFGLDMHFNNLDEMKINGNMVYNQQNVEQTKESAFTNSLGLTKGGYSDTVRNVTPNVELELFYSKYFKKKKRKLIANVLLNANNQSRNELVLEDYLEYLNEDLQNPISAFNQKQFILQKNRSNLTKGSISFIEPFYNHSLLELSYEFDYTKIDANRLVEDRLVPNSYYYIDSLSVYYDYEFISHKATLNYQFEPSKRFKMNFGFALQPLVMTGRLPLNGEEYKYDNINLIPTANFFYKFSKEMDWQINYRGKNNQPNFIQIAPVIDNSNSRNVIIGNPLLEAEYAHRLSSTFRKTVNSRMQYFETNFAFNVVLNKIVSDKRTLKNSIVQETTFKNTSGYYDWRWYYTFNTPFISENIQLDLTGSSDFYNNLSFIDERKRTTKQLLLNQLIQLKYSWEDVFETSIHTNYLWNQAKYDIPYKTNIEIQSLFVGMGAKGYLDDNWAIGVEMSQRFNDGYKDAKLNVNQTLMNSFVEFTFLPNKAALLRLQGFDLFNQNKNSGIISEYVGNDVYEARNNRLGRYFMLSLNIRLQKVPKGK